MRRLVVLLLAACGGDGKPLPPTDPAGLAATLDALAGFGNKHAGTPEDMAAGDYIQQRFTDLGLADVHTESFTFPKWELVSSQMTVSIDGAELSPGFDVFEASGGGTVDAPIINCETANDVDLAGKDLTGKVALVVRDPSFHRSAQYRKVAAKGAVAMLYLSIAPENLRQVGSVRFDWEAAGQIPAITIGATDGATIKQAVLGGKTVRAKIDVAVRTTPGTGRNIVGTIAGKRPERIVMGAHYDTWFAGSSDNGSGVAELLAVAERRTHRTRPEYTLVFVGYDGEEIGLYGGYDYLRKHQVVGGEPILAFLNFESPSANTPDIAAVVHSNQPALDLALQEAHLRQIYGVYAGLEVVAQLFGGIIPTDIQGAYRSGVPTVTTAVTNAYYHTVKDTPDTVDLQLLADSTDGFDTAIDLIGKHPTGDFDISDPQLWTASVSASVTASVTATPGAIVGVDATVTAGDGTPGAGVPATASVLADDFILVGSAAGMTDASGRVHFDVDVAPTGAGNRFLHVTAGPKYPLVEKIIALP